MHVRCCRTRNLNAGEHLERIWWSNTRARCSKEDLKLSFWTRRILLIDEPNYFCSVAKRHTCFWNNHLNVGLTGPRKQFRNMMDTSYSFEFGANICLDVFFCLDVMLVKVQPINNMSLLMTSDEEIERKTVLSDCTTDSSQKGTLFFHPFAFIKPIYDDKNRVS